jgi:hypothetical protein
MASSQKTAVRPVITTGIPITTRVRLAVSPGGYGVRAAAGVEAYVMDARAAAAVSMSAMVVQRPRDSWIAAIAAAASTRSAG